MKVLTAELAQTNKRERISGGVYIEFESVQNVHKDDYFKVKVDGKIYDFKATGIKVEGDNLRITAKEVGYWATKLDHKGVDLRLVIGGEIIPVIDKEEIKEIYTRSCWC